jgi:hypothetical protein|tara:strand:+ start:510 stop:959 length:450 start_codon:yes stop_codon:yes gene_type:complete
MTHITLSSGELFQGAVMGVLRRVRNMKAGRKELYSPPKTGAWDRHIEGALGELALAKHLNVFIADHTDRKCPDVGDVDVRMSTYANAHLIVHPDDPDDRDIWLVTGFLGEYVIRGWMNSKDAKQQKWWGGPDNERPSCYFVPQGELNNG